MGLYKAFLFGPDPIASMSATGNYQVSVHLVKQFQRRRFFRNQPIRNKNCLWWVCLLMDRDEMSNLYKGPYIDVSRNRQFWFLIGRFF
jgi:hypothetical protein